MARPEEGGSEGPFIEFERDRGLDRERRELALDRGCRPPGFGDGDGGIITELDTGHCQYDCTVHT